MPFIVMFSEAGLLVVAHDWTPLGGVGMTFCHMGIRPPSLRGGKEGRRQPPEKEGRKVCQAVAGSPNCSWSEEKGWRERREERNRRKI